LLDSNRKGVEPAGIRPSQNIDVVAVVLVADLGLAASPTVASTVK